MVCWNLCHIGATMGIGPGNQPYGEAKGGAGQGAPVWPLAIQGCWQGLMPLSGITLCLPMLIKNKILINFLFKYTDSNSQHVYPCIL